MKNQVQKHPRKHYLIVPFFAALVVLAAFWACKKGSSPSSPAQNATIKLIVASTWKYDTSGIDLNNDGQVDIGDTVLQPCVKDNTYTLLADSTGTMDEGATKCSPSAPQTDPLHWFLTSNYTVLNITSPISILNGNLNILNISSTNWTLYKDTTYGGFSFRYLFILKH